MKKFSLIKIGFTILSICVLIYFFKAPADTTHVPSGHYLGYASLKDEISNISLSIEGNFPVWLEGILLRNGPGIIESPQQWFEGLALLHRFVFNKGHIAYTNKFLDSSRYQEYQKTGIIGYDQYTRLPSLLTRILNYFGNNHLKSSEIIQNANVNIAFINDNYVALTEVPFPVVFDPHTLQTIGNLYYDDILPKINIESAHPLYDHNGDAINYGVKFGRQSSYEIYRIKPHSSTRRIIASVPCEKPAYMHSFSITNNYIILSEIPLRVSPLKLMVMRYFKPFIQNFEWCPGEGAVFTVINKQTGEVVGRYKADPFFMFHHINAHEEGKNIIVDIACYENAHIFFGKGEWKSPYPYRFVINLENGAIERSLLSRNSFEMPGINPHYAMRPYRYLYGISQKEGTTDQYPSYLLKIDASGHQEDRWWNEEGCYPGEPILIPHPEASFEDEGVILSLVLDEKAEKSFLLCLDAATMREMGRAWLPHYVPLGFHGKYYAVY